MAEYEVEHGIKSDESKSKHIDRPDLSSFYSELDYSTSGRGAHASPEPDHVAAPHLLLADAYNHILRDNPNVSALLEPMIEQLLSAADHPQAELKGVPNSFFDELERVERKKLKPDDDCPICGNAFLDDKHILVVRLPCHKDHMFDLECIQPWLKLNTTCPLDRKDVYTPKKPEKKVETPHAADDEEEWDDMYA
ncbi:hypothetical protein EJ05DRAFT_474160 [Pseudovirgaria hyperparasitica]|uniref:RING-type domain-containing protein n=1 Tax=Pseudovirgaria hyperparasitica TaxID=470096 RepID=A0A6A6WEF8_9PEZI|nr:uncharacterized protein EJ05DRAFT_474160 [Pseudovirgaria hyperparasitica]KAF2760266.1 hypothetical protein EJ05DRAFT_474160 [Pseudovirgaria hyperparasitica]